MRIRRRASGNTAINCLRLAIVRRSAARDVEQWGGRYNNTCIFTRHVDNVHTMNYISYFSYHKPLLSITDGRQSTQAWRPYMYDDVVGIN